MNRIIRFRAWHKEKKQMIVGDLVYWFKACAESGKGESIFNACEWMQFTGLLDKNGKEIYEGDICENGDWEGDAHAYNYRVEEVKYNEQEAGFSGWNPNEDGMTCEVIGNIYENPDLLK